MGARRYMEFLLSVITNICTKYRQKNYNENQQLTWLKLWKNVTDEAQHSVKMSAHACNS